MSIVCKSSAEIEKMRRSGRVVRQVLDSLRTIVAPGVSTMDLERSAEKQIRDAGAKPAFKGYYDYPCVLCTSVNNEIVHGIPSVARKLKAAIENRLGLHALLTRDADTTVPLDDRAAFANNNKADLFISLHANASLRNMKARCRPRMRLPNSSLKSHAAVISLSGGMR